MEQAVIILDEGAKEAGLADMLFNLIRQNLEQKPHRLKSFQALKSNVVIVANDIEITITFAFQSGKLRIYNGILGEADLKIIADHETILELSLIKISMGLPNYFDSNGRDILKKLLFGNLKIEGMLKHPLQLIHLTKLFSVN